MTESSSVQYEMPKAYEPGKVEAKWYQFWLEKGYFTPKIDPKEAVCHHHATAQCYRGASYRACLNRHYGGHYDPLAPDEG